MTTAQPDPFDELRKLMTPENCQRFVDTIYAAFRLGEDEAKTIIWWKKRQPRYFEISIRKDAD